MTYSLTLTLIFSKTVPFCNNNALIPDTPALIKISGTFREENYWNASGILTLKILKSQRSRNTRVAVNNQDFVCFCTKECQNDTHPIIQSSKKRLNVAP